MPPPCPDTKADADVNLSESESESPSMWHRSSQTEVSGVVEQKEMATQTEETSMGLRRYSRAQLSARPASPRRS
eukprot:4181951-Karenia_brevis.AAC.1